MATAWGNTAGTNRGEDILVTGLTVAGTYTSVGVLVDLDANTTSVLVGAAATPSTTRSISGVTGAKFPMFASYNGDACEANFGGTAFERPLPAGYSAWDAACVWNSADKSPNMTLSGSDLIATGAANSTWKGVRGTVSHVTSGKWYFEVKARLVTAPADGRFMIGIGNASALLTNYFSFNANGASWQSHGNFGTNNGFTGGASPVWDEYPNAWRTIRSDVSHNGGRWYVEVLCNTTPSSSGAGLIMGVQTAGGNLRDRIGIDLFSAGIQSNRNWLAPGGGFSVNVVSAALTATHVYCLDIDIGAQTIATRLDNGAWSAAQSFSAIFTRGLGHVEDFFFAITLNDAPSIYDSATVNFGATAFTYTPPTGAVGWDTAFGGATLGSVSGAFVESLYADPGTVSLSGMIVETMYTAPVPDVQVSGLYVEALRSSASGVATAISESGMIVEVLRTGITNPVYMVGMFVDVMFQSPAAAVQHAGMIVEVLRVSELPPPGARGFNRAVTIIT
jgi:hypothetical protein